MPLELHNWKTRERAFRSRGLPCTQAEILILDYQPKFFQRNISVMQKGQYMYIIAQ